MRIKEDKDSYKARGVIHRDNRHDHSERKFEHKNKPHLDQKTFNSLMKLKRILKKKKVQEKS